MDSTGFLLVSATETECAPILGKISGCTSITPRLYTGTLQGQPVDILISGIGAVATTFRLTQTLMSRSYSHAVSMGIAGSFAANIPVEEVVQITEDCFADLGIDDNGTFLNLREAKLNNKDDCFSEDFIINPSPASSIHRKVLGITMQTATGSRKRIDELVHKYQPDVETMENAAFFYVCRMMQIPFASFRAISNKVEPRNREKWFITEAIEKINHAIIDFYFHK